MVALLSLVAAAGGIATSPLFAVSDIRVVGVDARHAQEVRGVAGLRPGDNLLTADLAGAGTRVEQLAWVRHARARRLPPGTVEVRVVPREPVVAVHLPDSVWQVDAEGVVVAGGAGSGLPAVWAPNSVLPGVGEEVRDAALRTALAVDGLLPAPLRRLVERYEARTSRDLRLHLVGDVTVRFGAAERVRAKARSTLLLLDQARRQADRRHQEGLGVAEIDVRAADRPVLVPVADERS